MSSPDCPDCGKPYSQHTDLMLGLCKNKHFKKILKKWAIVPALAFLIAVPFIGAGWADSDLHIYGQQGNEIVLTRQAIQTISEPQGSTITGTCNCQVSSTLGGFVQQPARDGTTHFSGQVREIQSTLQFSDGTTVLVEPDRFPVPVWVLYVIAVVVLVIVVMILKMRSGGTL